MESRELTRTELSGIRKQVTGKCANFDGETRTCIPLDSMCYMLGKAWTGYYCRYFESAVLPTEPALEASLLDRDISERQKICPVCGKVFLPKTCQVYCSDKCREKGRQKYFREHKRKERSDKA